MSEGHQPIKHTSPICPSHVEEPVCIGAPVCTGIGETEVLERIVLDLEEFTAAAIAAGLLPVGFTGSVVEAVALSKRVVITECEVFTNKVLVNGLLHKDLLFKFAPDTQPDFGPVLLTNTDCTLTLAETVDLVVDCPFGACITVPGACPGDKCEVILACVDAEKELLIDTDADGFADQFEEKVCILIRVKTNRHQMITVQPVTSICPHFTSNSACPPSPCPDQVGLPSTTFVVRPTGVGRADFPTI